MKRIFITFTLSLISCFTKLPTEPELFVQDSNYTQLSDTAKSNMNGVYTVISGKEEFGEEVVCKWVDNRWCIYSKHDVVYSENAGGSVGDSIILKGYIRIVRSGSGSQLKLAILPSEGGRDLVADNIPSKIILRGKITDDNIIVLQRVRPLYNSSAEFHVLAHRGGGRNSERLGISENSIEMIKFAKILGATGVEIDVKRTRDGHLILFHDNTFSPRTIQGTYLLGDVGNFDLQQITLFGRLIYGESIPTLSEALNAVIDSTDLSVVWLDVKDPHIVDEVILAQKDAITKAASVQRKVDILLGIPTDDILNAYRSSIYANTTPVLVELDASIALSLQTCKAWAPRWTNGIPSVSTINQMHANSILVFTWTLDVQDYISDFLYKSSIDGILTNYPSLVAGMHYSRN